MRDLPLGNVTGNRSIRLLPDTCPECGHAITNEEAKRIHANHEARKREFETQINARSDYRIRAMEAEILARGKEAGKAEATGENRDLIIKLAAATQRAETAEANFDERVAVEAASQVAAYRNTVQTEQAKKDFANFELVEKWKKKATELQIAMDQQNAQKKGKDAERDIARELNQRFPNDKIEVIGVGVNGADILQHVNYRGKFVCTIIHESKVTDRFLKDYPTKLRADQIKASAAHAILWTKTMPTNVTDPWTHIEGVHVCEFPAGIALTTILRTFEIKMSTKEGDKRDERGLQMLDFIGSGRGMELLKTIMDNSEAEAKLDKAERQAHDTVWNKRADNRKARNNLLETLIAEIDRIAGVDF